MRNVVRVVIVIMVCASLIGCATAPPRLKRCEPTLRPINPLPPSAQDAAPSMSSPGVRP